MKKEPIRVLIADDHVMVRSGLRLFLLAFEDLKLIGEAENGEEALNLCNREKPDVVLMDMVMPGIDGIQATSEIRSQFPHTQVIGLTSFFEPEMIQKMLDAGAISFHLKSISATELASVIRDANDGKPTISLEIQNLLKGQRSSSPQSLKYNLSARERGVLACMVNGMTNAQIAQELVISLSTVKYHITSIFNKLNVINRPEAMSLALQERLVPVTFHPKKVIKE
jgi:two-component system, NarL family, response regulator LiaR